MKKKNSMHILDKIGKKIEKLLIYYTNYKNIQTHEQNFSLIFEILIVSNIFYLKKYTKNKKDILKKLIFRDVGFFKKNFWSKKSYYNLGQKIKIKSNNNVIRKMIFLMQKEKKRVGKIKSNLEYSKITIENFKKFQKIFYEKAYEVKNFSQNKRKKITKTCKKINFLVLVFIGILIYKFLNFKINKN